RRSRAHESYAHDKGAGVDEAVEASTNLLDLCNAPRRASAQPAIDHDHHQQLITACEVDRDQGQHINAPRVGVHGAVPPANVNHREVCKPHALGGVHLGISHEHKAWLILDLMSQKVKNARDVIFYERLFLLQFREDEQANANRVYANNGHSYASPEDEAAAAIMEQDPRGEFTRDEDDDDDSPGGGAGAVGRGGSGSGRGAAPPAPPEPESDDDDVQEVIPQHRHDSTVSGLQLLGLHTATSTAKPMDAKIKALESRDTWVLVDRAAIKGRRILSEKWVFHVKTAADGTIERFKAQWVIRGYDQRHGIDFDQTFAPISRHTSVRILLAIAAAQHLPLRQIDVKNAFLYALVDAVIYVEQPHTYGEGDSRVC
ncbi:unnamed protein product, partial [Closterium sp. NIES-53]